MTNDTDTTVRGCRWSEARQRWERVIRPGVSKEACGHAHVGGMLENDPDLLPTGSWRHTCMVPGDEKSCPGCRAALDGVVSR